MAQTWLNGQLVDDTAATISVRDTGLLHGAGVFTTVRAHHGAAFRLADHLDRLRHSCEALSIPLMHSDGELAEAIESLLKANALSEARLRITITRGEVSRQAQEGVQVRPNTFITAVPFEPYPADYYEQGMTVLAYDTQKLNPYDVQAGHKTLDYFSRFAGMRDAVSRGAAEALWFNVHNYLQSATMGNVFVVKSGKLITPPTQADLASEAVRQRTPYPRSNVLPGITRKVILELTAKAGIACEIAPLTVQQLLEADECFITNSVMEVMPVCRIERKSIGADRPGDLTRKIGALYRTELDAVTQDV